MPDLTPTALRPYVLRAVVSLCGGAAGQPVKAADVVSHVVEALKLVDEDDIKKVASNANWVGTQVLRKQNLLAPADKRGWWVLTPEGATTFGGTPVPVDEDTLPTQLSPPPPAPPAPTRSKWADDTGGVVVFSTSTRDTYPEDPYIRALAVAHLRCFGKYVEHDQTCRTCPLQDSCRNTLFTVFHSLGETLHARDVRAAKNPARPPLPQPAPSESLDAIIDILEGVGGNPPDNSDADLTGSEMLAPIESVCYKCQGVLPEQTLVIYVPGVGSRHKVCP